MSARKGGLGRGLGSLIPTGEAKQLSSVVAGVPVDVANLNRVAINSISLIHANLEQSLMKRRWQS